MARRGWVPRALLVTLLAGAFFASVLVSRYADRARLDFLSGAAVRKGMRSKLYRKKAIKRQRSDMCPSGKMPRCVKGLSYCVKTPKRTGSRKKGSRILYLK